MYAARAIAEAENITVRPEEVNAEYRRLSVQQDTPEADIRRVLAPETVAAALAAQKVQRFLLDNAVVTSVMDRIRSDSMSFFTRYAMDALMKTTHPEINRRQCWNLHPHRTPCTACKDICPFGDAIFTRPNLVKDWDPCTDCGLCVSACRSGCIAPSPEQVQRDTAPADSDNDTVWIGCEKSTRKNTLVRAACRPSRGRRWPTWP
mgnify:CR=1 FL=1